MKRKIAVPLLLIILLAACSDLDTRLAKFSGALSTAIGGAATAVIELSQTGVITPEEDRAITTALLNLNTAGTNYNNWLAAYRAAKTKPDMTQLKAILGAINLSGTDLVKAFNVKNPAAQQKLLLTAQLINLSIKLSTEIISTIK